MKKNITFSIIIIIVILAIILIIKSVYMVSETEQVIITQFGAPVEEPITKAGLHLKKPFIQEVVRIDKRILEWEGDPNNIPTKDKLFIYIDAFARWRISDPLLFMQRLRDERSAKSRLNDILDGAMRIAVANHDLIEIIRSTNRTPEQDTTLIADEIMTAEPLKTIQTGRAKIAEQVKAGASPALKELGIELLDVRFRRINYSQEVQTKINDRMISERNLIAEKFLSQGRGEAARIKGETEKDLLKIQSEAYRKEQELRGDADAKASKIYAEAYTQSKMATEFYAFLKTMEIYNATFDDSVTALISTQGNLFELLTSTPEISVPTQPIAITPSAPVISNDTPTTQTQP